MKEIYLKYMKLKIYWKKENGIRIQKIKGIPSKKQDY